MKTITFSYFLECPDEQIAKRQMMAICKNLIDVSDSSVKFIDIEKIAEKANSIGLPVFWTLYNELTKIFNEQDVSRVILTNFLGSVFSNKYPMSSFERIYLINMLKMINFAIISFQSEEYMRTRFSVVDSDAVLTVDFPVVEYKFDSEYFIDLVSKLEELEKTISPRVSKLYASIRLYARVGQFICPLFSKINSETEFIGVPEKYCYYIGLGIQDYMKALADKKFIKAFPDCLSAAGLARGLMNGKILVAPGNQLMLSLFLRLSGKEPVKKTNK